MKFTHVPKAKQKSALQHHLKAIFGDAEIGSFSVWEQGIAQTWVWPKSDINKDQLESCLKSSLPFLAVRYTPETIWFTRPTDSGFYQLALNSGTELQYWSSGVLQASQWFNVEPSVEKIKRFVRSQGASPKGISGPFTELSACDEPWLNSVPPLFKRQASHKRYLVMAVVMISLLVMSFQVATVVQWHMAQSYIDNKVSQLQQTASEQIEAREQARESRVELQRHLALFNMPDALWAQHYVAQLLPTELSVKLVEWERSANRIELTVEGEIDSTLSVVQALQGDRVTDVSVKPLGQKQQYLISLTITEL